MNKFKVLLLTLIVTMFIACSPSTKDEIQDLKICPQCKMKLSESNIHSSTINQNAKRHYFDDIGCMVLWSKDNNIDLKKIETKVFSNDTKRYINAFDVFYKINEKTPMSYGFSAYEHHQENSISFDEVIMKMLRGEHMANSKIRKQILGN